MAKLGTQEGAPWHEAAARPTHKQSGLPSDTFPFADEADVRWGRDVLKATSCLSREQDLGLQAQGDGLLAVCAVRL